MGEAKRRAAWRHKNSNSTVELRQEDDHEVARKIVDDSADGRIIVGHLRPATHFIYGGMPPADKPCLWMFPVYTLNRDHILQLSGISTGEIYDGKRRLEFFTLLGKTRHRFPEGLQVFNVDNDLMLAWLAEEFWHGPGTDFRKTIEADFVARGEDIVALRAEHERRCARRAVAGTA
jgi:hypothetical protein